MHRMERRMAMLLLMTLTLSGCAFITLDLKSLMRPPSMEERVIRKGSKDKVLVVEILGPITTTAARDTFMPRQGTLERLDAVFSRAKNDANIKGIILRIDSPGGGVTSSDLVYRRIMEYKGSQHIPVMACITNLGASGAYMVALSADRIIALPTSTVGNVGVLLLSLSFQGLLDTLGIRDQTLTSGKYKDAGSPFRDMSAEEKAIYNDIVMDFYRNFIDKVKQHRPVTEEDLKIVGDGRIMTASAALKYHLIDEIGYYETALKAVETSANIQNPTVITYRHEGENTGGFYSWP